MNSCGNIYLRRLTDILNVLVGKMSFPVNIFTVTGTGTASDPWILGVDNIYHGQIGFPLIIGGNTYTIVGFDDTEGAMKLSLTGTVTLINGDGSLPYTSFSMYNVFFFYGTPKATAGETTSIIDKNGVFEAFPFVWLWNTPDECQEVFHRDPEDALERESTVRLFFLTKSKSDDKRTEAIVENYIGPMQRLKENFVKVLDDPYNGVFYWEEKETTKNYHNLGITITQKGKSAALFPGEMSGVEMKVTLKLYKFFGDPY